MLLDGETVCWLDHEVWRHAVSGTSSPDKSSLRYHFLLVFDDGLIICFRSLLAGEDPSELVDGLLAVDSEAGGVVGLCSVCRRLADGTLLPYLGVRVRLLQNEQLLLSREAIQRFGFGDLLDYLIVLIQLVLGFPLVLFLEILLETLIGVITFGSLRELLPEGVGSHFALLDDREHVVDFGVALIGVYSDCLIKIPASRLSSAES